MKNLRENIDEFEGQPINPSSLEMPKTVISKIAKNIGYLSLLILTSCGQGDTKNEVSSVDHSGNNAVESKVDSIRIGNPVFTVNDDGSTFFSMVYTGKTRPKEIEVTVNYYDESGNKVMKPITAIVQKNHNFGITNAYVGKAPVSGERVYAEAELRAKNGDEVIIQKVSRVPVPSRDDQPSN